MKIKINKNNYISGVGTIVCCIYKNIPCIVLGREKNKSNYLGKDQYEDFGGSISNEKESIAKNCKYELREETANMINLENEDILNKKIKYKNMEMGKYLDLEIPKRKNNYFRCYYQRIDQINEKIFNENLRLLKKNSNTPECYLEIDKIVFIPIDNFTNLLFNFEINKGYHNYKELFLNIKDIDNNIIRISERTFRLLLNPLNQFNENNKKITLNINGLEICKYLLSKKSLNIKLKEIKNNQHDFLYNTTSFI